MRMLKQLDSRFRHIVRAMSSAILLAALLRHGLHVYGGFSREEIRISALITVGIVIATTIVLQRLFRR
jgi:hypothetical protein